MRTPLSRSGVPLLTTLLLLLFAQGIPAQSSAAASAPPPVAQPTADSALTVKRTLPANGEIRRLDLPAGFLTITVPGADAVTGLVTDPNSTGASFGRVEPAKVRLDTEIVRVSSFEDLLRQLKDNNIAATPDVLGLILDLNPTVSRLDSLAPQTKLLLPEVEGDSAFRRLAASQPTTLVNDLAFAQREALNKEQAEIKTLSERIDVSLSSPPSYLLGNERDTVTVKRALDTADDSLQVISKAFAVSQRLREQTALEAKTLKSIVGEAMNSGGGLSMEKMQTVQAIGEAMEARSQDISGGGTGTALVEVHTLKRSDGSEIRNKRVFCAPTLNQTDVIKYRNPSSPTSEALPLGGQYTCWAGEGDNVTAISDKISITIRTKNDPIRLQLPGDN